MSQNIIAIICYVICDQVIYNNGLISLNASENHKIQKWSVGRIYVRIAIGRLETESCAESHVISHDCRIVALV